jgi:hypothetical protein
MINSRTKDSFSSNKLKGKRRAEHQWLTPAVLAPWESEIRRIEV